MPTSSPGAFAAAVGRAARAAELVDRSLGRRRPRDAVRGADRGRATPSWRAQGVEVAVIEAGLGGRFDATNVIPSKVQVLTSVGLEHTRWLGPTIADIAGGEARRGQRGGTSCWVPALHPDAEAVAERVAARARRADRSLAGTDPGVAVGAPGAFQRRNFALARAAARGLPRRARSRRGGRGGGAEVRVPGRLQMVGEDPLTLARRRPQPGRDRRAGRVAARAVAAARDRVVGGALDPRRQGRRRDAGQAVAGLRCAGVHEQSESRVPCPRRRSQSLAGQLAAAAGRGRRAIRGPRCAVPVRWPAPTGSCSPPARSI